MSKSKVFKSLFFFSILCFQVISESFSQNSSEKKEKVIYQNNPRTIANAGFADIVETLLPTVVNISTSLDFDKNGQDNLLDSFPRTPAFDDIKRDYDKQSGDNKRKLSSIGSGFVISRNGYIVTNSHVIDDSNEISVSLHDGSRYKAKVIGVDKKSDLALLKINANKELKFARFGDSNRARIGDWVIAIGNPYGLGGSVSVGIVSARGRDINNGQSDEYIQTDAAINKGNSGGPLFNAQGEVIGISSAIFSPSGGSVGIGFATPSSNATLVIDQLRSRGEVSRPWIGISVQDLTEELADSLKIDRLRGAFVSDVTSDGPADKAGIVVSDVIMRFDDQEVDDMKSLLKIVNRTPIGKNVKAVIWRNGKYRTVNLLVEKLTEKEQIQQIQNKKTESSTTTTTTTKTTSNRKKTKSLRIIGVTISEFKTENSDEIGLMVSDSPLKSEAFSKGVVTGDLIISVNENSVNSVEAFREEVQNSIRKNKKIVVIFKRNEHIFTVNLNPRAKN